MPRYASVRMRVKRALVNRLKTILVSNGYNTDVRRVMKFRRSINTIEKPAILIIPGDVDPYQSDTHFFSEKLNVELWGIIGRSQNHDLEADLIAADIERALCCQNPIGGYIIDTSAPGGREIYVTRAKDAVIYSEAFKEAAICCVNVILDYRYLLSDNKKWDSSDNLVTVVEDDDE